MGKTKCILLITILFISGCNTVYHKQQVSDESTDRITVGKVQREIKVGMSSADVVQVLGSPNIVTTDEQRCEVWVYDKVSRDIAYSASSSFGTLILLGANGIAGAERSTQKTLTIVIKFDGNGKVRDFAYHNSQF